MNVQPILLVAQSLADDHVAGIQSGVLKALAGSPHSLAVTCVNNGDAAAAQEAGRLAQQLRPLGAILVPAACSDDDLAAALTQAGCRQVAIAPDAQGDPASLICSNDRQGMCDAANYLVALGHRRIGFISISDESRTARERELGFIDALAQHGLDFGAELVVQADDTAESGCEAGLLLMAVSPRPSAILASTDLQAAGVLQAAMLCSITVPGGLSVMGFGDTSLALALSPPLTTMRLPCQEMGFTAAIKLLDPDHASALPVEFLCELTPRGSTGPVAA